MSLKNTSKWNSPLYIWIGKFEGEEIKVGCKGSMQNDQKDHCQFTFDIRKHDMYICFLVITVSNIQNF